MMMLERDSLYARLQPPLLFGHRGYSRLAPENTLPAFRLLLEHDIPGVEVDVRLCRSGEAVIFHDADLKRITGRSARVEDLSLEELRSLDAGAWFSPAFAGTRIPLLSEVFELLGDRVYYDLELKWDKVGTGMLEPAVLELIEAFGLRDNCLVSSFNPFCVRHFEKLGGGIPTALIYSRNGEMWPIFRHGQGRLLCRSPIIKPHHLQVRSVSSFLHRRLFRTPIYAWTVDEPEEVDRLLALGVSGIYANDPGRIKKHLGL
jgi:glycerophosphoryl diester phosphodiesterase